MSGAIGSHALAYVAQGTYGCVIKDVLSCTAAPPVAYAPPMGFADSTVSKLTTRRAARRNRAIHAALTAVDSTFAFTVPFETECAISEDARARVAADGQCGKLLAAASAALNDVVQVTMREGVTFSDYVADATDVPLHALYELMYSVCEGAHTLHGFEIGHGDLKNTNLVYFKKDNRVRMIDYDFMFSYDLRTPEKLAAKLPGEPTYADVLRGMSDSALTERFAAASQSGVAVTRFHSVQSYFPPDAVFLSDAAMQAGAWNGRAFDGNPSIALQKTDHLKGFSVLTDAYDVNMAALLRDVDQIRLDLDAYSARDKLAHYNPGKYTIYQLGYVLLRMFGELRDRLAWYDVALENRMRALITHMMLPRVQDRLDWEVMLPELRKWIDDMRKEEQPSLHGPYVYWFPTSADEISAAATEFLKLAQQDADNGDFWLLHDDDAVRHNRAFPSSSRVLAIATQTDNNDTTCTVEGPHGLPRGESMHSAQMLFGVIAAVNARGFTTLYMRADVATPALRAAFSLVGAASNQCKLDLTRVAPCDKALPFETSIAVRDLRFSKKRPRDRA